MPDVHNKSKKTKTLVCLEKSGLLFLLRNQMSNEAPVMKYSFHRRELPCPPAISFSSPEGRSIFMNALTSGGGESYYDLISHFVTQGKPAFCGLSTLVIVLNALNIDPRRSWRGSPWRYFDEEVSYSSSLLPPPSFPPHHPLSSPPRSTSTAAQPWI